MPISDYKLWLHGKATPTVGVSIGYGGSGYSEDEVDFGYADPNINASGGKMGLHVVITQAFNVLGSANIWIVHGTATAPTTKLTGRYFALADLALGKHYYIPLPPANKEFVRAYFEITGSNPTAGLLDMWIGPDTDGGV